ncbi:MAG: pyridoxal phosphate-dependent aminotransferase family protein, partial [Gemmatimonadetes bacterium]|nr:pyridoxal phosphate-dependent aminotransferase family protein [Gemmatimonadota bacterium]
MTLFDKCHRYTDAREAQAAGVYPYFIKIEEARETEVRVEGEWKLMAGSNNYLGLTHDPRVMKASRDAITQFGSGCTGSRFLNGTLDIHLELEAELADLVHKEAAILFSTGFQVNLGVIAALVGRGDYVVTDRDDHASIVDGCLLCAGEFVRFAHNDMESLESR